jgi:oxygen-independent coproporphyrinogen-3 oxidase
MCHFETEFRIDSPYQEIHEKIKLDLSEMIADGLVLIDNNKVTVTNSGIPFVRNCCMAFDQDLKAGEILDKKFSSTI